MHLLLLTRRGDQSGSQQLQPRRMGRLRDRVVLSAPAGASLTALTATAAALTAHTAQTAAVAIAAAGTALNSSLLLPGRHPRVLPGRLAAALPHAPRHGREPVPAPDPRRYRAKLHQPHP